MYKFCVKHTKLLIFGLVFGLILNVNVTGSFLPVILHTKAQASEVDILPFAAGETLTVTSGYESSNHNGSKAYCFGATQRFAVDFAPVPSNKRIGIRSARSGIIRIAYNGNGSYPGYGGFGRMVAIETNKGLDVYAHLKFVNTTILNNVGKTIGQGVGLGELGTTGLSSGPHLHWERFTNYCKTSIKANFRNIGSPIRGQSVTAQTLNSPSPSLPPAPKPLTLAERIKGRVSVHRGGDRRLYISWDNGNGQWQHPPIASTAPYGVSTNYAPTTILDKYGYLNVFYVGDDKQVYQQILKDSTWYTKGTGLYTSHQVEVVLHQGYFNIFARGSQSQLLQVSSGDNRNWGQVRTIPTNHPVYSNPSAAVRESELLVAYPTTGNQIATVKSTNGVQWFDNRTIPGLRTSTGVGLTTYQNHFVMVHLGGDKRGYFNASNNGTDWTQAVPVPYITINHGVDLEVMGDTLHLVHGGGDNRLYYQTTKRHDGHGWSSPTVQHPDHNTFRATTIVGK